MKRHEGYYFVKFEDSIKWDICEWRKTLTQPDGCWFTTKDSNRYHDTDFDEIDERRITREPVEPKPEFVTEGQNVYAISPAGNIAGKIKIFDKK
jgi:hypothetical protein